MENTLGEAIDCIWNQTLWDFEFLIINAGMAEILQTYHDSGIKIINDQENIGLTKSLNKGLRLTRGEYIARMDADDISLPQRLEKEVAFLNQNKNTGLVRTYYLMINESGKVVLYTIEYLTENGELKERLLEGNPFGHGSAMFRAECIEKVGFYGEEFNPAQDYDLWYSLSRIGKIIQIDKVLLKLRIHQDSMSAKCRYAQKWIADSVSLQNIKPICGHRLNRKVIEVLFGWHKEAFFDTISI